MAFDPLSAIVTGGAALLNYFGGKSAQDKAIEAQNATNAQNFANARYFAENSIGMRVADAKANDIHPAYALGAPTASAPTFTVGAAGTPFNPMAPLAKGLTDIARDGQDISRAAIAPLPGGAKVAALETAQRLASNNIDIETKRMQYEILKARYANMVGTPPVGPFPVPETHKVEERPPLVAGGYRWETAPDTSNAETYEKRYGDDGPASWAINTGILLRDAAHNVAKNGPGGGFEWFAPAGSGRSFVDRLGIEAKWRKMQRDPNFTMGY